MAPPEAHPAVAMGVLIGAEMPDFDYAIRLWGGRIAYLKNHRGPTHGLAVLPLLSGLVAGLLHYAWPGAPAFWTLMLWTLLGGLSHVFFDLCNDYGTQGLWPFSRRWVALDLLPIIDVWTLGLIVVGWILTWATPLPREAIFGGVWLLITLYVAGRFWLRRQAFQLVTAHFDLSPDCGAVVPCGPGWRGERVTIQPRLLSLNAWRYVVQMPREYWVGTVWVRQGRVGDPERARNQHDRVVLASLKSQFVTAFAGWTRLPRVQVDRVESLYRVRWSEARYEQENFSPFTAFAWLDSDLQLVDEGFGQYRPQAIDQEMMRRRLRIEMGRQDP